uniref:Putative secreted protein n=1 Tax=Anopheles marajoara TaxID=58244 RepID=A0A2M4C9J1_9DIPT
MAISFVCVAVLCCFSRSNLSFFLRKHIKSTPAFLSLPAQSKIEPLQNHRFSCVRLPYKLKLVLRVLQALRRLHQESERARLGHEGRNGIVEF